MNKTELVDAIAKETGLSKKAVIGEKIEMQTFSFETNVYQANKKK